MRAAISVLVVLTAPALSLAAEPEKTYYVGEVKLSDRNGKPMGSQALLLEKIHDPDNSTIIERALIVQADGKVEERTATMKVKDDNSFTLTDDDKFVEGGGQLFGPAWKWTYFKATFKAKNGAIIDDENFMTDPSAATARKKIMGPDGRVIMYMETTVKGITPKTFEILRAGLMKK